MYLIVIEYHGPKALNSYFGPIDSFIKACEIRDQIKEATKGGLKSVTVQSLCSAEPFIQLRRVFK